MVFSAPWFLFLIATRILFTNFTLCQKNNSLCVFAWFVFLTMTKPGAKQIDNPWDIMIESFSFFSFCPMKCSLLSSFTLLLSWPRKFAHLCTGPSCTALNLFHMWNSISAWFGEGRTPATNPVLPYVYHTSVVIYRDGWSYMYHCTNIRKSILLGTKGAGKQCIGQYCEHEKNQCDLHDTVNMFLVRQAVGVISGVPRQSCNPWILYC